MQESTAILFLNGDTYRREGVKMIQLTTGTTNFIREDGSLSIPPGTGGSPTSFVNQAKWEDF